MYKLIRHQPIKLHYLKVPVNIKTWSFVVSFSAAFAIIFAFEPVSHIFQANLILNRIALCMYQRIN